MNLPHRGAKRRPEECSVTDRWPKTYRRPVVKVSAAAVLLLLLTACAAVHPVSAGQSSNPNQAIPWLPLAADLTTSPLPSPQPLPIPPGTPTCTANQLVGTLLGSQGATGHIVTAFAFSGSGQYACFLDGTPSVTLLDSRGSALAFPARAPYFPPTVIGPALVQPGPTPEPHTALKDGQAGLTIDWISQPEACMVGNSGASSDAVTVASSVIGIPAGGSVLIPIPNTPDAYPCAGLGVGSFEPPAAPFDASPPPPLASVTIQAPLTAKTGKPLRYLVNLANDTDQPMDLTATCPNYEEELFSDIPGGSPPLGGKHFYRLNCDPAGTIDIGKSVAFQMVFDVPADATPATYTLVFRLGFGNATTKGAQANVVLISG